MKIGFKKILLCTHRIKRTSTVIIENLSKNCVEMVKILCLDLCFVIFLITVLASLKSVLLGKKTSPPTLLILQLHKKKLQKPEATVIKLLGVTSVDDQERLYWFQNLENAVEWITIYIAATCTVFLTYFVQSSPFPVPCDKAEKLTHLSRSTWSKLRSWMMMMWNSRKLNWWSKGHKQ